MQNLRAKGDLEIIYTSPFIVSIEVEAQRQLNGDK